MVDYIEVYRYGNFGSNRYPIYPRGPQLLKILYKIVQSSGIFRDCKAVMKDCIP